MVFFAVLVIGSLVALLVQSLRGRRSARDAARVGAALAFVFAGVSHFGTPTQFVQHIPEWVPYRLALVYATGTLEIVLGLGLLTRYRRQVAAALAAYLVLVFPANVYVAVAGVPVDGLAGGWYPWLRLAFQPVFIGWVLWSTPPAPDARPVGDPAPAAG
jgi:uncharacterized membrane protein